MKSFRSLALVLFVAVSLDGCGYMARRTLETGPNGPETPGTLGLAFERLSIPSSGRHLDGFLVPAATRCGKVPVLVLFHGVQETISMWVGAQKFLSEHCVTSMVFDYTGSGDSSRPASMEAVNEDAVAVYAFARARFPRERLFLLGHSMGNAILFESMPRFSSPPEGVVCANAFSSLRDFAGRSSWIYEFLMYFSPDWWNNVRSVSAVHAPLLVVTSDGDTVAPPADGRKIFDAANEPRQIVLLHGYPHNALYRDPQAAWWESTLRFVGAPLVPSAGTPK